MRFLSFLPEGPGVFHMIQMGSMYGNIITKQALFQDKDRDFSKFVHGIPRPPDEPLDFYRRCT